MVENHFLSGGSSSIGKNHRSVAGRISSLMWWRTPFLVVQLGRFQHREHPWIITHRIHGAAIYGVPWIPSIYPSHVSIYSSTMDPSWVMGWMKAWCFSYGWLSLIPITRWSPDGFISWFPPEFCGFNLELVPLFADEFRVAFWWNLPSLKLGRNPQIPRQFRCSHSQVATHSGGKQTGVHALGWERPVARAGGGQVVEMLSQLWKFEVSGKFSSLPWNMSHEI